MVVWRATLFAFVSVDRAFTCTILGSGCHKSLTECGTRVKSA
jgi:hypothetical protein